MPGPPSRASRGARWWRPRVRAAIRNSVRAAWRGESHQPSRHSTADVADDGTAVRRRRPRRAARIRVAAPRAGRSQRSGWIDPAGSRKPASTRRTTRSRSSSSTARPARCAARRSAGPARSRRWIRGGTTAAQAEPRQDRTRDRPPSAELGRAGQGTWRATRAAVRPTRPTTPATRGSGPARSARVATCSGSEPSGSACASIQRRHRSARSRSSGAPRRRYTRPRAAVSRSHAPPP